MSDATKTIGQSRLMLHAGGKLCSMEDLQRVATPQGTDTWTPVPHVRVIDEVRETLDRTGLGVTDEAYALYRNGDRFFGLLGLSIKGGDGDYQVVVGVRNSHDQSFPIGLVVGSRVFVCDNLAFSSEIEVTRRHTKRVFEDFPRLIATAAGRINESAERQERRFNHYRGFELTDNQVHDILVQSLDVEAIGCQALPKVLQQWREPIHEEFKPRTMWSLWNAYTEVYKSLAPQRLPRHTFALQGLLDLTTQFSLAG